MKEWLKKHWRNGLRFQIAISLLILGGVVANVLQFYTFTRTDDDVLPFTVAAVTVTSTTVQAGDVLTYTRKICNASDERRTGGVGRRLIPVDGDEEIEIPSANTIELADGMCETRESRLTVPPETPPGMWRLRIFVGAGGNSPLSSLTSGPFAVTEGVEGGE